LEYTQIFLPAELLKLKTDACENAGRDRANRLTRITGDVLKKTEKNSK